MNRNREAKLLGKRLFNNLPLPSFIGGRRLLNANGDIDASSSGYEYLISTLSYIRSKIVEQKFYEIPFADFIPIDVGEGAWMEEIVQNLTFNTGGSFYQGDVDIQAETGRLAMVGAGLDKISMDVKTWAKGTGWTIMEISKAAAANNWDVVESKLRSLKKNWDLGLQETAFLGHPDGTLTGLLNSTEVTINTSLITVAISAMSEAQFTTFVAGLLPAYFTNSNDTSLPDTMIIPNSDYLGLGVPYSDTYPNISKLQYMLDFLQRMTGNANFKILGLSYAQATINVSRSISKNRYVLYRNNEDTMKMAVPVDFTMLEADTSNKINWQQAAYGQYSGVLVNRKREVLYLDQTAT
ncbi:MAG: DUF2184 domain-containing protein [Bacteroidales bacterium]|nr:DUF2184 domain-containing protein [Bacteroidales bacterium]